MNQKSILMYNLKDWILTRVYKDDTGVQNSVKVSINPLDIISLEEYPFDTLVSETGSLCWVTTKHLVLLLRALLIGFMKGKIKNKINF